MRNISMPKLIYTIFFLLCCTLYVVLPKEGSVRWVHILTSLVGVLVVFTIVEPFLKEKLSYDLNKIFVVLLVFIHIPHVLLFGLAMWGGYYANGFWSLVFIAPVSALLIVCLTLLKKEKGGRAPKKGSKKGSTSES